MFFSIRSMRLYFFLLILIMSAYGNHKHGYDVIIDIIDEPMLTTNPSGIAYRITGF